MKQNKARIMDIAEWHEHSLSETGAIEYVFCALVSVGGFFLVIAFILALVNGDAWAIQVVSLLKSIFGG